MAKAKTIFVCEECGHETSGWLGRCPSCGAWNSFFAQKETAPPKAGERRGSWLSQEGEAGAEVIDLSSVDIQKAPKEPTHIKELDRVLGGGLVQGSLILLGGDPGIAAFGCALERCGEGGELRVAQFGVPDDQSGQGVGGAHVSPPAPS